MSCNLLIFIVALSMLSTASPSLQSETEGPYKILMLLPFSSKSHRNAFLPLAKGLLARGHKVWMLSSLPPLNVHPNLTEVSHGIPGLSDMEFNFLEMRKNTSFWMDFFYQSMDRLSTEMYDREMVKNLYEMKVEFHVVIFSELFSEPAFPFLQRKPTISLATSGVITFFSAKLGNVFNPACQGAFGFDPPTPLSFSDRILNFLIRLIESPIWSYSLGLQNVEFQLKKRFPEFSTIDELRKNVSLTLVNNHFSIDHPFPLLPSQVEVGGMHCASASPLPKELDDWLGKENSTGVIYFNLGSIVRGDMLTDENKQIFLGAFKKLDMKVLWKFEKDLPDLPPNVKIQKWFPQQDILADPRVKVFVTHAGLLGTQESIYHGTPMIALPVFGDQPRNARIIEEKGFGVALKWDQIDEEAIFQALKEVVGNPQYERSVRAASENFRDQQFLPVETAVWWTEYVARYGGAPALRSPAAELSNREFFNLDILLLFHVLLAVVLWLIQKMLRSIFRRGRLLVKGDYQKVGK